ncbi:MAG TPA: tRNA (adenosine(37)-N6)-dimethylallyltransferase MiaA [Daejeonella sp.]|nr:tRNA (adenosine(37)-N6)-dimethylallyltransferase MiaA [Daejeonella sp.]
MPDKTLIVIAGPTAIGKTALAIRIAREFDTEIISADSRQFYREMDIGTAKPSPQELQAAKHHFINSHSINTEFSVGDFETQALEILSQIFSKHNIAVMVGGSGLYINGVCQGFDELPKAAAGTREKLNQLFQNQGITALQEQLKAADPVYYQEVDIQNPQRLIRALEVWETSGKPFSEYRTRKIKNRPFNIVKIGLNTSREELYQRINHRVDLMIEAGLISEVERLLPYRDYNALHTVGYSELFDYFDGHISLDEAIAKIKQNTRRFAKRQLTWFKKAEDMTWFEPDDYAGIDAYLNSKLQS